MPGKKDSTTRPERPESFVDFINQIDALILSVKELHDLLVTKRFRFDKDHPHLDKIKSEREYLIGKCKWFSRALARKGLSQKALDSLSKELEAKLDELENECVVTDEKLQNEISTPGIFKNAAKQCLPRDH